MKGLRDTLGTGITHSVVCYIVGLEMNEVQTIFLIAQLLYLEITLNNVRPVLSTVRHKPLHFLVDHVMCRAM